jgi:hypothetical protein
MAQQEFYIFIQEPSRQPFYVRIGQESHSSSAEGHIILARLKDSVYNLYIGFPRLRGEELFTITINRKDHGYELQNVNGKRQLFDLQKLEIVSPVATTLSDGQTIRKTDSYSALMAGVVDDSAVLFISPVDTLTSDTALANVKTDSGAVARTVACRTKRKKKKAIAADTTTLVQQDSTKIVRVDTAAMITNNDSARNATVAAAPQPDSSVRDKRDIIRLSTENIEEGKLLIYVDRTGPANDTIRIIIPRRL